MRSKNLYPPANGVDERLIELITDHEGIKQFAHTDSLGYISVGIGRCVDSRRGKGLTVEECFYLLNNDINEIKAKLDDYDWYKRLDYVRQGLMVEMAFNLGVAGLMGFKNMLEAMQLKRFDIAAKEMADSKWATQIGAKRLKNMQDRMRQGHY